MRSSERGDFLLKRIDQSSWKNVTIQILYCYHRCKSGQQYQVWQCNNSRVHVTEHLLGYEMADTPLRSRIVINPNKVEKPTAISIEKKTILFESMFAALTVVQNRSHHLSRIAVLLLFLVAHHRHFSAKDAFPAKERNPEISTTMKQDTSKILPPALNLMVGWIGPVEE